MRTFLCDTTGSLDTDNDTRGDFFYSNGVFQKYNRRKVSKKEVNTSGALLGCVVAGLTRPGNGSNPRALDGCHESVLLQPPTLPYKVMRNPPPQQQQPCCSVSGWKYNTGGFALCGSKQRPE